MIDWLVNWLRCTALTSALSLHWGYLNMDPPYQTLKRVMHMCSIRIFTLTVIWKKKHFKTSIFWKSWEWLLFVAVPHNKMTYSWMNLSFKLLYVGLQSINKMTFDITQFGWCDWIPLGLPGLLVCFFSLRQMKIPKTITPMTSTTSTTSTTKIRMMGFRASCVPGSVVESGPNSSISRVQKPGQSHHSE